MHYRYDERSAGGSEEKAEPFHLPGASSIDRFYLSNLDTRVPVASSAYIEIATKKYTLRYYHKRAANLWGGSGFDCRKMSGL